MTRLVLATRCDSSLAIYRARTHVECRSRRFRNLLSQLAKQAGRSSRGLHHATGGNPLFVSEILATEGDAVPVTVSDAVLARAARLSSAAREIAELVCVVPSKAEPWLLDQALHPGETEIESCLGIGMLRDKDGAVSFRHDLVRRALLDSLSQPRLQSLHAAVLSILTIRPGISASRLAHHASGARDAEQVLRFGPTAAAQAASVGAHREAAMHYQTILEYAAGIAPEEHANLMEQLSYECHLTGQHEDAIQAQQSALEIWRALGLQKKEGNALRWLSRLSLFAGDMTRAGQYGVDAVTTLELLEKSPELAMAYCERADFHVYMKSHEEHASIEWAQRAIVLAQPWGDSEILSHALCTLGTARLIGGDSSGWADLDQSLKLAVSASLPDRVVAAYASLAAMSISRREYAQASNCLRVGLAYCEARDMDWWWLYMLADRSRMRFEQGDWDGASDDAGTILRHPRATSLMRIPALRTLAHIRIRRGDPDARSPLDEARILAGPVPDLQRMGTLAAIHAEAAFLVGDRETVLREIQPVYELVCQRRDPRMKGELAAWLMRLGKLDHCPSDIAEPYASEISGNWQQASRAWQELGCRYEHASLLAWYGSEAEQREALVIFDELGAAPAALALRKQMRADGIRGVPRGSRTTTLTNPFGLTQREAQVLELLAKGLRNSAIAKRLFVSPKTVDHHVSAILAKIGVPSRAEAIAMAHRQPGAVENR
jgi:DNA-binding CsgD family transcriptional regulator